MITEPSTIWRRLAADQFWSVSTLWVAAIAISRPSSASRTAVSTPALRSDCLVIDWMVARVFLTRWFSSLTSSWR